MFFTLIFKFLNTWFNMRSIHVKNPLYDEMSHEDNIATRWIENDGFS